MLFKQKTFVAFPVCGQAGGTDNVPRWQAVEHSSGTGEAHAGVVPVQGGGEPHVTHAICAVQPEYVIEKSDSNTKVRQPFVAAIAPGDDVPV